jgi:hypothetical protein
MKWFKKEKDPYSAKQFARDINKNMTRDNRIPENVLESWYLASIQFKNHGDEYIKVWREIYIDLCREDGFFKGWTSDELFNIGTHYYQRSWIENHGFQPPYCPRPSSPPKKP